MRRAQRRVHAIVWPLLGPASIIGLLVAVGSRTPTPIQDPPDAVRAAQSAAQPTEPASIGSATPAPPSTAARAPAGEPDAAPPSARETRP